MPKGNRRLRSRAVSAMNDLGFSPCYLWNQQKCNELTTHGVSEIASQHQELISSKMFISVILSAAQPRLFQTETLEREVEVEPSCGRLSPQAKSRAKSREPFGPRRFFFYSYCVREFSQHLSPAHAFLELRLAPSMSGQLAYGISTPPGIFPLLLQTKALPPMHPWATLAWPLGDAWVALGWPKGHPNPIPVGRGSQLFERRAAQNRRASNRHPETSGATGSEGPKLA